MDSLAEYTKKVEIGDIYKDLGLGKSISAKKVTVYVDGVENASQPARDITPRVMTRTSTAITAF